MPDGAQQPATFMVSIPGVIETTTQAFSNAQAISYALSQAFTSRNSFWFKGKRYDGEVGLKALIADVLADPGMFDYAQQLPGQPSQPVEIPLSPQAPVNSDMTGFAPPQDARAPATSNPPTPQPAPATASRDGGIEAIVRKAEDEGIEESMVGPIVSEAAKALELSHGEQDALWEGLLVVAGRHETAVKDGEGPGLEAVATRYCWKSAVRKGKAIPHSSKEADFHNGNPSALASGWLAKAAAPQESGSTESAEPEKIADLRRVLTEGFGVKVDGVKVDAFSASAILQVYDALSPDAKARYLEFPVEKMADIAFKLANRTTAGANDNGHYVSLVRFGDSSEPKEEPRSDGEKDGLYSQWSQSLATDEIVHWYTEQLMEGMPGNVVQRKGKDGKTYSVSTGWDREPWMLQGTEFAESYAASPNPQEWFKNIEAQGLSDKLEQVLIEKAYDDPDSYDNEWENFAEDLTNLMETVNPGTPKVWRVNMRNFGWMGEDADGTVEANTGEELVQKILPSTENSFKVYKQGRGIKIDNAHHDAPMGGEMYYITPFDAEAPNPPATPRERQLAVAPEMAGELNEYHEQRLQQNRPKEQPQPKTDFAPEQLEEAPSTPGEVPTMNPRDRQRKLDQLLDQYNEEQDPARKQQIEEQMRSLRASLAGHGWLRTAEKQLATCEGCGLTAEVDMEGAALFPITEAESGFDNPMVDALLTTSGWVIAAPGGAFADIEYCPDCAKREFGPGEKESESAVEDSQAAMVKLSPSDEEAERPAPEDYTITPTGPLGSRYSVSQVEGKFLGEFNTWDEAERAISDKMEQEHFWPSVWSINDHGNWDPVIFGKNRGVEHGDQ